MNEALIGWLMAADVPEGALTLEDLLSRPDWHADASARERRLFLLVRREDVETATAICQRCPAREP